MSSRLSDGIEKTAFLGALARGAGKAISAPVKFLGSKVLGLGTTEGKINAALTALGASSDVGRYQEQFKQTER